MLKRFLLVDAVALAGLYTLRIIAGAGAVYGAVVLLAAVVLRVPVSQSRVREALRGVGFAATAAEAPALGRGYRVEDLAVLQSFGTAAGYLSVLVLALYINSPEIEPLYHRPKVIWMLCVLLLYWISRVWMTAHRGGDARRSGRLCPERPRQPRARPAGRDHRRRRDLKLQMASRVVSSWGNVIRASACRLSTCAAVTSAFPRLPVPRVRCCPFGNGRSYGDSCLNVGGALLQTRSLDRFISFRSRHGRVWPARLACCWPTSCGSWFPRAGFCPQSPEPVMSRSAARSPTTCTARIITVPALSAATCGSSSCCARTATRTVCSQTENPTWFAATVGGLGLTGVITWAELQLRRIPGPWLDVESIRFANVEEFFALSAESEQSLRIHGGLDRLSEPRQTARPRHPAARESRCGAAGRRAAGAERKCQCRFRYRCRSSTALSLRVFNTLHYHRQLRGRRHSSQHFQLLLFPARRHPALEPAVWPEGLLSISVCRTDSHGPRGDGGIARDHRPQRAGLVSRGAEAFRLREPRPACCRFLAKALRSLSTFLTRALAVERLFESLDRIVSRGGRYALSRQRRHACPARCSAAATRAGRNFRNTSTPPAPRASGGGSRRTREKNTDHRRHVGNRGGHGAHFCRAG